jgi:hypothetical protein
LSNISASFPYLEHLKLDQCIYLDSQITVDLEDSNEDEDTSSDDRADNDFEEPNRDEGEINIANSDKEQMDTDISTGTRNSEGEELDTSSKEEDSDSDHDLQATNFGVYTTTIYNIPLISSRCKTEIITFQTLPTL